MYKNARQDFFLKFVRDISVLLFGLVLAASLISCSKSNRIISNASLNVINAAPAFDQVLIKTPNANGYFNQLAGIYYTASAVYNVPVGVIPVTVANSTDTSKSVYNSNITVSAGAIYSFFITGPSVNDVIIHRDTIPIRTDSSVGVRFINLSPNSAPVNIALSSTPGVNEFSGIVYKTITSYNSYPASSNDPQVYTFQATDDIGNILASVDVSAGMYPFVTKNLTLVLSGLAGATGSNALQLFVVNNF